MGLTASYMYMDSFWTLVSAAGVRVAVELVDYTCSNLNREDYYCKSVDISRRDYF